MVLISNFFYDMSGHERYEQFDTKAINLIGFLYE